MVKSLDEIIHAHRTKVCDYLLDTYQRQDTSALSMTKEEKADLLDAEAITEIRKLFDEVIPPKGYFGESDDSKQHAKGYNQAITEVRARLDKLLESELE